MAIDTRFQKLFEAGRIGTMEIKNRIVMPPMMTNLASRDGYVTDQIRSYYEERAKGGAGLVIVEIACVEFPRGRLSEYQLSIHDDKYLPGLTELAQAIKRHGARAAIQLHHGGRQASSKVTYCQPAAPSAVPKPSSRIAAMRHKVETPHEFTVKEIEDLIGLFAKAAERAKRAGFEGVEIHSASDYLIAQFLSSAVNKREDEYGGKLENRARFLAEVIQAVRASVGDTYPVWCRINGRQYGPEGVITVEEAKETAQIAQRAGADAISQSLWIFELEPGMPPLTAEQKGSRQHLATAIKSVVSVPVISAGRLTPELGEQILRDGNADFIAIGRGLLADPEIPNKAAEGRLDDIAPCITCRMCLEFIAHRGERIRCTVNPVLGRENAPGFEPASVRKKVLVIGGGPAGLEAAKVAAQRGHEVTLCEKEENLGGQMRVAVVPPYKEEMKPLIDYLVTQVEKTGVTVRKGTEVNLEFIDEVNPDVIILGTGVNWTVPSIQGIEKNRVVFAIDVLMDKGNVGQKVAVIGGGEVGCETAEFLVDQGKEVIIVEMLEEMLTDARNAAEGVLLLKRLAEKGVVMLTDVTCNEVTDRGLNITTKEGEDKTIEADTIVLAAGAEPKIDLYELISERPGNVYRIGDSLEPRGIMEAISDGFSIGCAI